MTVTLTKPVSPKPTSPVFGVRFAASVDRVTHVDECADEARARRFLGALHFMGNADAHLVRRDTPASGWVPVEVTQ